MIGCAKTGVNLSVGAPQQLMPEPGLVSRCREIAAETGAEIRLGSDPFEAVRGADAVYTDVWASMGEEAKLAERIELLSPYRVTTELMEASGAESIFLHDLPAVKGNEVTEEVFESERSLVFEQAENRKHTIKAVILATLLG